MFFEFSHYQRLKRFSISKGADLFGVADISDSRVKEDFSLSPELKNKVHRAVCIGVGLSSPILSEIDQEPTKLYFHHYKTGNMFLDQLAFAVSRWISAKNYLAVPIPASQIVDWEQQRAHLSHRAMGLLAGLGWIGKNNLLVSKKFGSQMRLVTILTDLKLKTDKPLENGCGPCAACVKVCPAKAISERVQDFKYQACFEKLKNFQRQNIVGQYICGICVNACGGKYGNTKQNAH